MSHKNLNKQQTKLLTAFLYNRHQIQHYTGQLAKDTSKSLKDLGAISLQSSEQVLRLVDIDEFLI